MTDVLSTVDAIARSIDGNFGCLDPNKHAHCSRLSEQKIVKYLRALGAQYPTTRYDFGVSRLDVESFEYYTIDGCFHDTLDVVIPLHMFMDDGEIVITSMTRESLGRYLTETSTMATRPYTFWGVVLGRNYNSGSLHKCMIVFNHLTRKIYYFDPNATWSHLTGEEQITQYIDYALSRYFDVADYEYVWSSAWRPPSSVQTIPNRRDWDCGNCQTLCVIMAHLLLSGDYIDPAETYIDLLAASQRDEFVYNYVCRLYTSTNTIAHSLDPSGAHHPIDPSGAHHPIDPSGAHHPIDPSGAHHHIV